MMLTQAAELINAKRNEERFLATLNTYTRTYKLELDLNTGLTPVEFDNYLYSLIEKF